MRHAKKTMVNKQEEFLNAQPLERVLAKANADFFIQPRPKGHGNC